MELENLRDLFKMFLSIAIDQVKIESANLKKLQDKRFKLCFDLKTFTKYYSFTFEHSLNKKGILEIKLNNDYQNEENTFERNENIEEIEMDTLYDEFIDYVSKNNI